MISGNDRCVASETFISIVRNSFCGAVRSGG